MSKQSRPINRTALPCLQSYISLIDPHAVLTLDNISRQDQILPAAECFSPIHPAHYQMPFFAVVGKVYSMSDSRRECSFKPSDSKRVLFTAKSGICPYSRKSAASWAPSIFPYPSGVFQLIPVRQEPFQHILPEELMILFQLFN
jgi:hypothetical protein